MGIRSWHRYTAILLPFWQKSNLYYRPIIGGQVTVFDLFFTTKQEIKGSGLAVAKNVIQDHGREISIESKEGKGTTVNIQIPVFIPVAGDLSH
jgi:hypothetical protein